MTCEAVTIPDHSRAGDVLALNYYGRALERILTPEDIARRHVEVWRFHSTVSPSRRLH